MHGKSSVVCLLALAGSIGFYFARSHRAEKPSAPRIARPKDRSLPARAFSIPRVNRAISGLTLARLNLEGKSADLSTIEPVPNANPLVSEQTQLHSLSSANPHDAFPLSFEPNVGQAGKSSMFLARGGDLTALFTRDEIIFRSRQGDPLTLRIGIVNSQPRRRNSSARIANSVFTWSGQEKLRCESNYLIGSPSHWHTRIPHFARVESTSANGVEVSAYGSADGRLEYDLQLAPGMNPAHLHLKLTGANNLHIDPDGNLSMNVGSANVTMKKPAVYELISDKWRRSTHAHRRAAGSRGPRVRDRGESRGMRLHRRTTRSRAKARLNCAATSNRSPRSDRAPATDVPCRNRSSRRKSIRAIKKYLSGEYVLEADGTVGFRIEAHDPRATLVIDPSISISYATFLGGTGSETATSVGMDAAGKIYIAGTTSSNTTFPEGAANRVGPADGPSEFFIAKIDPTQTGANSLLYLTFLGGSGTQSGGVIAVDGAGDVAITGTTTSSDYPVNAGSAPSNSLAAPLNDTVVTELDPTGAALKFSTFFGGGGSQSLTGPGGIALDSSGNIYIASDTTSQNLPVTANAFQTMWDGQTGDDFLAIFAPPAQAGALPTLTYCTYLDTNSQSPPAVGGIAVDVNQNVYIAGSTSNSVSGFPVQHAFQSEYGGGASDAYLMKLSPLGQGALDLVYSTLLGGSGTDQALAVALDLAEPPNAYVTGTTQSANFPVNGTVAGFQSAFNGKATANAFLTVISQGALSGQASLVYSTYLGGSASDAGQGIAVIAPNAVYLTGSASSFDFPWHDNVQAFNGASDAFVAKLDTTSAGAASLIYATPLGGTSPPGGSASATGTAVAADSSGHVYVAGTTTSGNFPTAVSTSASLNGFQGSCSSCQQFPALSGAFFVELLESSTPQPSVYFTAQKVTFSASSDGTPQFVGIVNAGEAPLVISGMQVTGANAADFALSGQNTCTGSPISPGTNPLGCSFEVAFTPSIVGAESAVVAVTDNAPGSPQILELSGVGNGAISGPLAQISPLSLSFSSEPEGSTSSQTLTVTNGGNQPLQSINYSIAGPDAQQFRLDLPQSGATECTPNPLGPGASCGIGVDFQPSSQGTFTAEVDIYDNSQNNPNAEQVIPLTGTGTAAVPAATISPASLSFNSVSVGTVDGSQSVTLKNTGSVPLNLAGIALAGANAQDFTIASNATSCPLASGSVAASASCTVAVQFAPQSSGAKTASLTFSDNASGSPQQVTLSGTANPLASLTAVPTSLPFGNLPVGTSASLSLTITNSGSGTAGVGAISISGSNAADFSAPAAACPAIAAGGNCAIFVQFQLPMTAGPGPRSATLALGGVTPSNISLSGTGTEAGISVPPTFSFSPQIAETASASELVVVTNSATGPYAGALSISSVTPSGANSGDFKIISNECLSTVTEPGMTCTLQVAFVPCMGGSANCSVAVCGANDGARSATLTINDNVPGNPAVIALSGTAMEFCPEPVSGQPISQPIAAGQSETFKLQVGSSAGFTGSIALACAATPKTPAFSVWLGGCSVSPTSTQISSAAPGAFQLTITSTAPTTIQSRVHDGPAMPQNRTGYAAGFCGIWLAMFLSWVWLRRKESRESSAGPAKNEGWVQAALLTLALAVGLAACGSSGGSDTGPTPQPGSPPGSYSVTVTATFNTTNGSGQPLAVTSTLAVPITITAVAASSD